MADTDALSQVLADRDYADSGAAQSSQRDNSWSNSSAASGVRSAGSSMASYGQSQLNSVRNEAMSGMNRSTMPSFKKGGTVRKTGPARLHKGELVVPRSKAKKVKRMMRRKGRD